MHRPRYRLGATPRALAAATIPAAALLFSATLAFSDPSYTILPISRGPVSPGPAAVYDFVLFNSTGGNPASNLAIATVEAHDARLHDLGSRPAVWSPGSGQTATVLPLPFPDFTGASYGNALAANAAGTIVGSVAYNGSRALRWDSATATPTVLDALSPLGDRHASASANAINAAGDIAGVAEKLVDGDPLASYGVFPVVWPAGSNTPVALPVNPAPGATPIFPLSLSPIAITDSRTVFGTARLNNSSGGAGPYIAVRWDPGTSTFTELAQSVPPLTRADTYLTAANPAGVAVGYVDRSSPSTGYGDRRALRWDAGQDTAVELHAFSTDPLDLPANFALSTAFSINSAGVAAGSAELFDAAHHDLGPRAALWLPGSATPLDVNSLIDPASGWTLWGINVITDDGSLFGLGSYDPDGPAGPTPAQSLPFRLTPIPTPEPAAALLAPLAIATLVSRRRRT